MLFRSDDEGDEGNDDDEALRQVMATGPRADAEALVSYAVGVAFGRWDVRIGADPSHHRNDSTLAGWATSCANLALVRVRTSGETDPSRRTTFEHRALTQRIVPKPPDTLALKIFRIGPHSLQDLTRAETRVDVGFVTRDRIKHFARVIGR